MNSPAHRYLQLTFLMVITTILVGLLALPLAFGVWLPDVFFDGTHTLNPDQPAALATSVISAFREV